MLAKNAINGKMYLIKEKPSRPSGPVECHGMNYSNEFMLFLAFTDWGERVMLTVSLNEEIKEFKRI